MGVFSSDSLMKACTEKPRVFLKQVYFSDGSTLPLKRNSIVVFVGANNCGKSQVLRDVETYLDDYNHMETKVIKDADILYEGSIVEKDFWNRNFKIDDRGSYINLYSGALTNHSIVSSDWQEHRLKNGMHLMFVHRLGTEERLESSNPLYRSNDSTNHPIFKMFESSKLENRISNLFKQAFGLDLIMNRGDLTSILLHVGQAPNKNDYTIAQQDEYYRIIEEMPQLHCQGDGMRSYVSILLNTFVTDYSIMLIDEPEAFLHPPQARMIGKMLAQNNPDDRQLFVSTHSEDFLQGLLDIDNANVIVIRMDREDEINKISILSNSMIADLWKKPILRYSNILGGLFHQSVVVCESDYDCLFYQALIDAVYESKKELAPDILFVHCGGKGRIKEAVKALVAINVPVTAICDFDILQEKREFKSLVQAFNVDYDAEVSEEMVTIYDYINSENSKQPDFWERLKIIGKAGLNGEAPAAYDKVETKCRSFGLFIVPVGEMESFDRTVNRKKKDWVYEVIERYELSTEMKLEEARRFVYGIIDNNNDMV